MSVGSAWLHAVLLSAVWLTLSPASTAGFRPPGTEADAEYRQQVAPNLRELVPPEQFQSIRMSLRELQRQQSVEYAVSEVTIDRIAASPCGNALSRLVEQFLIDPRVPKAMDAVAGGLKDLPPAYDRPNPWKAAEDGRQLIGQMISYFADWCTFLPRINGSHDNGLVFIEDFAWLYYHNEAGRAFVQGRNPLAPEEPLAVGLDFTREFSKQRGAFMDSPASTAFIEEWIRDPRIEIRDYRKTSPKEYRSWNEFFAREIVADHEKQIIPSRPATMPLEQYPERDYIVVSPTDCIMNPLVQVLEKDGVPTRKLIENPLQLNTVLDVKGIPVSLAALLKGVDPRYRDAFVGGTGLSCVLMPNTYHHFHAPVNGTIVHAAVIPSGTYGYSDFPNWVPTSGNVGLPGTDFSQFQDFQRGVIIIEVKYADLAGRELSGYVASIPVGLNTIGSVVLDPEIIPGKTVKRGYTRLGNFLYGGSLNILLFSSGLAEGSVQTRLGTQINLLSVGRSPP